MRCSGLPRRPGNARSASVVDPASVGFLNEVGPKNFLDWTRGYSIMFANAAEAEALAGSDDLTSQMRHLGSRYDRVVIKRGARGAAIGNRDGVRLNLPAPKVGVLDTTGAGDAFAAGFLSAQLHGKTETECMQAGIEAGTRAVMQVGGQPG